MGRQSGIDAVQVSNRTLEVLSAGEELRATELSEELQSVRQILEDVNDTDSSRFIRVLQGLLNHTVLKEAQDLQGMYSAAADRIFNQVGSCPLTRAVAFYPLAALL